MSIVEEVVQATRKRISRKRAAVESANDSVIAPLDGGDGVSPEFMRPATEDALEIAAEVRHHYVQVAAYYIAERRGFHGGAEHRDWELAEREIERMIASRTSCA
jgi:hypothetical protein